VAKYGEKIQIRIGEEEMRVIRAMEDIWGGSKAQVIRTIIRLWGVSAESGAINMERLGEELNKRMTEVDI